MKRLLPLFLLLAFPFTAIAQQWSPQQQEVLDTVQKMWTTLTDHGDMDMNVWQQATGADKDLLWWWTDQGLPQTFESMPRIFKKFAGGRYTWSEIRPIAIRVYDEVAFVAFYSYGEWIDKDGARHLWEDKRLELFKKEGERWRFIGGMVDPVIPY